MLVMETRHKISIRNVAEGTTEQEITELFRPYCRVVEASVLCGREYGFVDVVLPDNPRSLEELDRLVNNTMLNGNRPRVGGEEAAAVDSGADWEDSAVAGLATA